MRNIILNILNEIGISIDDEDISSDFDLSEYFIDSIQFITFIVELENELGFALPDDFLLFDKYRSFNALCGVLVEIKSNNSDLNKERGDNL